MDDMGVSKLSAKVFSKVNSFKKISQQNIRLLLSSEIYMRFI